MTLCKVASCAKLLACISSKNGCSCDMKSSGVMFVATPNAVVQRQPWQSEAATRLSGGGPAGPERTGTIGYAEPLGSVPFSKSAYHSTPFADTSKPPNLLISVHGVEDVSYSINSYSRWQVCQFEHGHLFGRWSQGVSARR